MISCILYASLHACCVPRSRCCNTMMQGYAGSHVGRRNSGQNGGAFAPCVRALRFACPWNVGKQFMVTLMLQLSSIRGRQWHIQPCCAVSAEVRARARCNSSRLEVSRAMPTGPVRGTGLDGGANGQSAAHVTAGERRQILGVTVHQRNKNKNANLMQSCVKRGLQ